MHELNIIGKISSSVLKFAQENDLEKVIGVQIIAGRLRDFDQEFMQRYFDRFTRGTVAEGAQIEITVLPITFNCKDCGETFEITGRQFLDHEGVMTCIKCGSKNINLVSGNEFFIDKILAVVKPGAEGPQL